jgi:uncharacterized protein
MDLRFESSVEFKALGERDGYGRVSGIASAEEQDLHGDVIEANAFHPLQPERVALLYAHDSSQPIGRWTSLRTIGRKLVAEGELMLSLPKAREVYEMVKAKVLTGLSVGFRAEPEDITRTAKGKRQIKRGQLVEISIVACPALGSARITECRSYGPSALAQKLGRLQSEWSADSARTIARFDDVEVKIGAYIAAAAEAGRIPQAEAVRLLKQMNSEMKARL